MSNMFHYQFDFAPVHKLRERITTIGGYPRLRPHEKTEAFESDVCRIARFQHRAKNGGKPIEGRLHVTILLQVSHKRGDVDNYAKAILDGLQKAQVFENDNQVDHLTVDRDFVAKGKENFFVAIAVTENE